MEETSSCNLNTPPPLPDRSRSVGSITVNKQVLRKRHTASATTLIPNNDDSLGGHYAHLEKHVKEVRRRKNNKLIQPKLSQFQVKEGDKVISTNWIDFIENVSLYKVGLICTD